MIIVEGPDGAGKTRLIDDLSLSHRLSYIHSPGYSPTLHLWIKDQLAKVSHRVLPRNTIYDRFFFSELVYGPIIRGHINYPSGFALEVTGLTLPKIQPLIILCLPPIDTVAKVVTYDSHLQGVLQHIRILWHGYEYLMPRWTFWARNYFVYDWSNFDEISAAVGSYLKGDDE